MDLDALDSLDAQLPPRHALESDEEDEFNPLTKQEPTPAHSNISILGDIPVQYDLIVATGNPGVFWARGAPLSDDIGTIAVNGVQVGLVCGSPFPGINVIVSEAFASLPVWAMYPYAEAIIDRLQPTSIALLDEYTLPTYITNSPSPIDDPPIRYLSAEAFDDPTGQAEPFAPPNLISTTSAAFLSLLSVSHIPDTTEWPSKLMNDVQQLLFYAVHESVDWEWELINESSSYFLKPNTASIPEIGEGGMYT